MKVTEGLYPEGLWHYFEEISAIPRESKKENKIRAYLEQTARDLGLRYTTDTPGNVIVFVPGTEGKETVILQAHMDMVCEKDSGTVFDFDNDSIKLVNDGEWITADGTTLGADNGIGVAAMLALMADRTIAHPPLELLFTVDEETGLTGACEMDPSLLSGKTLINLDSEDDGVIYIGCAGGTETEVTLNITRRTPEEGSIPVRLKVTGLKGGHSGSDIHKPLGNAVKIMNRFLFRVVKKYNCGLAAFDGGTKHNAIPREAEAVVYLQPRDIDSMKKDAETLVREIKEEFKEPFTSLLIDDDISFDRQPILEADTKKILALVYSVPHGLMIPLDVPGCPTKTSTNLATCRSFEDSFLVTTSQRSFIEASSEDVADRIQSLGEILGADVVRKNGYPAWKPDYDSPLLERCKSIYKKRFQKDPEIRIIHAGLECAVIEEKLPGTDMVSVGPTIEHAHSPSEKTPIKSVGLFWDLLLDLLKSLSE